MSSACGTKLNLTSRTWKWAQPQKLHCLAAEKRKDKNTPRQHAAPSPPCYRLNMSLQKAHRKRNLKMFHRPAVPPEPLLPSPTGHLRGFPPHAPGQGAQQVGDRPSRSGPKHQVQAIQSEGLTTATRTKNDGFRDTSR